MIPPEAIWNLVETYNSAIFPMQIITIAVAVILTCFLLAKPSPMVNKLMKAYLAFTYIWIGVMFAIIFASPPLFPQFIPLGILLIVIGILFAMDIFAGKTEFRLPETRGKKYFTIFWVICAFVLYPLIGWIIHSQTPMTMLVGVLPCPTTIFALALLAGATPEVDKKVFILLLAFALISGIYAPFERIYVDFLLLASGIYGLVMLIKNWEAIGKAERLAKIKQAI